MKVSELIVKVEEFLATIGVDLDMFYCITYFNDRIMRLQGKYSSNLVLKLCEYGFSVSDATGYLEVSIPLCPYNEQIKPVIDLEAYDGEYPLWFLNITLT